MFAVSWLYWFRFVFSVRNPYFFVWWVVGGQRYGYFDCHVRLKNTIRLGPSIRYENFFPYIKDNGVGEAAEFVINEQYGLYYFLNTVRVGYTMVSVPMLDMRRVYSKILINRRFLRIFSHKSHLRSHKLTRLLSKSKTGADHSDSCVTMVGLLMFVFKVFTARECMWFASNGLVRVNSRLIKNHNYRMGCGDIFNWIGGVFFFNNILYFRFSLSKWLWRKRRRSMRRLTKFVFYGGIVREGVHGLNRLQKTIYTGDVYWGAECDYRLCTGVVFFNLQTTWRGHFNNRGYALRNFNVWAFTH